MILIFSGTYFGFHPNHFLDDFIAVISLLGGWPPPDGSLLPLLTTHVFPLAVLPFLGVRCPFPYFIKAMLPF